MQAMDLKATQDDNLPASLSTGPSNGTSLGRRYSISELLRLKSSLPMVICDIDRINKLLDIDAIFNLPDEAFRHPDRFTCETAKLANIMKKVKTTQPTRKQLMLSSEDSGYHTRSDPSVNRDLRQVQWNLRRRESSDRSSQPHSAPSGLAAQQSENFQRFYRAVVSPTHVRVTAGGRIVPNTRATPSAYEWNGEKLHFESTQPGSQEEQSNQQAAFWPQNSLIPLPFPTLVPAGFMPPAGFLPQNNNLGLKVLNAQIPGAYTSAEPKTLEAQNMPPSNFETSQMPQPIKISPPNQFDNTKPFMYNGQVVYPIPKGFQPPPSSMPIPLTMIGNPHFIHGAPQPLPGYFSQQLPMPMPLPMPISVPGLAMGTHPNQFLVPQSQQPPLQLVNPNQSAEHRASPYMSLPGMMPIKNPDWVKSQLHGLRQHLNVIEAHLSGDQRHEQSYLMQLMSQRNGLQSQIEAMEAVYSEMTGSVAQRHDGSGTTNSNSGLSSETYNATAPKKKPSNASLTNQQPGVVVSVDLSSKVQESKAKDVKTKPGQVSTNGKAETKSRLSADAARAAPFQPRAQAAMFQNHTQSDFTHLLPTEPAIRSTQTELQRRTASAGAAHDDSALKPWDYSNFPRASTFQEQAISNGDNNLLPSLHRSSTFHGQTATSAGAPAMSSLAVPYLVGSLPFGVTATRNTPLDYSRPLTDAERRARFLYWGNKPRPSHSDLPKFDGKDFYPPSPIKDKACLEPAASTVFCSPQISRPEFGSVFDESTTIFHGSPSPVYSPTSVRQIGASGQSFTQGNTSYKPLSGQLPTTFNSLASVNWSSNNNFPTKLVGQNAVGNSLPGSFQGGNILPTLREAKFENDTTKPDRVFDPQSVTQTHPERNGEIVFDHAAAGSEQGNRGDNDCVASPESETSTVEIHLSPQKHDALMHKQAKLVTPFADRVANFNTEQQTLFLQNMLRNAAPMPGPALMGSISSATAHGYLPNFHGSATASLTPAILNNASGGRDMSGNKLFYQDAGGSSVTSASGKGPENRPLRHAIPIVRPPLDTLDAEGYMRYLQKKADDGTSAE